MSWYLNAQIAIFKFFGEKFKNMIILGREICPSGVSSSQRSQWKHAFSLLKHV